MRIERLLAIRQIFSRHDPQGLIKAGAPIHEYDNEVTFVLSHTERMLTTFRAIKVPDATLENHFDGRFFRDLVYATSVLYFGLELSGSPDKYQPLANDLRDWWLKEYIYEP
jgi:hypothetical protein